ncbi:hypothetical protein EPO66_05560, partial [bacterium]
MERAIFITKTENIRYVGLEYGRLYFGNEFCERLIPSISDIKFIAEFIMQRKIDFTFVTPYVTNQGIDILRALFEYISKNLPETEIVVNDWGVLKMLKDEFSFAKLSLGRLLTKQERDPRSVYLKNKVSFDMMEHFRGLYVDSLPVRDFLKGMGISRVELDNSLQGITRADPLLNASLHFPFVF